MDNLLTIILANDPKYFSSYFANIGDETVIFRNIRTLQSQNTVVISNYRSRICPEDCVSIIPTTYSATLKEVWTNIKDYSFRICKVFYGHIVLSERMISSIHKDKRRLGIYGNKQHIFGFVLHDAHKTEFLEWSLNEWRNHPESDLSALSKFRFGTLLISHDYSDEYDPNIETEVVQDGTKHTNRRYHVV